jgi:hypothetical protein
MHGRFYCIKAVKEIAGIFVKVHGLGALRGIIDHHFGWSSHPLEVVTEKFVICGFTARFDLSLDDGAVARNRVDG